MHQSHFIITRFNIPFLKKEGWERIFSEKYLDERYRIFEQYTVSSICKQSDKNFIWLVLFGEATPQKYINRNSQLEKICPQMRAIYVSDVEIENFQSYMNNLIRTLSPTGTKYIITTRIDNDDCFHRDMIATVKEMYADDKTERIISFDCGLQYIDNTHIISYILYPNNHFTSLIEPWNTTIKTVFYCDHFFAEKYTKVQHIKCQPLWLENLHGSNAVNAVHPEYYKLRTSWKGNLNEYGLSIYYNPISVLVSIMAHPSRFLWPIFSYNLNLPKLKMFFRRIVKR